MQALSLNLTAVLCVVIGAATFASVVPLSEPGMGIRVEAGKYVVCGKTVEVPQTVELAILPPDKVRVTGEAHVLTNEKPVAWHSGTALSKTLGPVDTGTRLPYAIVPESVRIHALPTGGVVYKEGVDYFLDHDWGGICRLEGGAIPSDKPVYVDYEVYLQRVDVVEVSPLGTVTVRKGKPSPVNVEIPDAHPGTTAIARIYVPYRTNVISEENIYPLPSRNITWRDFIKVSGREYLSHTLGRLKDGKPVTIVCWGDSVTAGGSPSSHDRCYVEVFRNRLKSAYPQSDITVVNAGIGGSNTDSRRSGFEQEVLAHSPDLITVEYVNDANMTPEHIASNYAEFMSRARTMNPNVEFVILTPHFVMPQWMGNFDKSVSAMRKAAADNKAALGDVANIWEHLRELGIPYMILEANGINHPNDLGHEFYAETLMTLMSLD